MKNGVDIYLQPLVYKHLTNRYTSYVAPFNTNQ
jgi:hypothetical protein